MVSNALQPKLLVALINRRNTAAAKVVAEVSLHKMVPIDAPFDAETVAAEIVLLDAETQATWDAINSKLDSALDLLNAHSETPASS